MNNIWEIYCAKTCIKKNNPTYLHPHLEKLNGYG
jgi:hypothetical protein